MNYPSSSQNLGGFYDPSFRLTPEEQARLEAIYRSMGVPQPAAPAEEFHEPEEEMNEEPSEPEQPSPPDDGTAAAPSSSAQHRRQQKRREQNKTAQRNFRKRKEEHLSILLAKIEALELQKKSFETQNQALLRELVLKRAENISLRAQHRRHSNPASLPEPSHQSQTRSFALPDTALVAGAPPPPSSVSSKGKQRQADSTTTATTINADDDFADEADDVARDEEARASPLPIETLMTLYTPFLAVWKQIRAQPGVAEGQVAAAAVLDRLREMAQYEDEESQVLSRLAEAGLVGRKSQAQQQQQQEEEKEEEEGDDALSRARSV